MQRQNYGTLCQPDPRDLETCACINQIAMPGGGPAMRGGLSALFRAGQIPTLRKARKAVVG